MEKKVVRMDAADVALILHALSEAGSLEREVELATMWIMGYDYDKSAGE